MIGRHSFSPRGRLLFALILCLAGSCHRAPSNRLPADGNVLLITIDTCRADHLGAYGHPTNLTPHIDSLASRGIVFERAFTPVPLTLPAHASLMTGILPFRHGVRINGTDKISADLPLLADEFQSAGYSTAAVIGSVVLQSSSGISRGFTSFDETFAANRSLPYGKWIAERPAVEVADRAIQWIRQNDRKPFFLWTHFYDPHAPYDSKEGTTDADAYDREIAAVDRQIGRLLEELKASGQLDKTLIVLTADHGESLGEHGESTHGIFLYDATLRVPLIVVPPSGTRQQRIDTPVSLVDVAPTIRQSAGIESRAEVDGRSLWPLLSGNVEGRDPIYGESTYAASLLGWSPLYALRTSDEKFIDAPRGELYSLTTDRGETRNVFSSENDQARRLARKLAALRNRPPAVKATTGNLALGAEEQARLASLGYLTAPAPADDRVELIDPKDHIAVWDRMERGIIARQRGDYEEAVRLLSGLELSSVGRSPQLLRDLAVSLRRTEQTKRAIDVYEKLVSSGVASAEDYFGLGIAWHLEKQPLKAIDAYERALQHDPLHLDSWLNLGNDALSLGRVEQAMEAYNKALQIDVRNADAFSGLAGVALERGDLAAAEKSLRRALQARPGDATIAANLEIVLAMKNSKRRASPFRSSSTQAGLAGSANSAIGSSR